MNEQKKVYTIALNSINKVAGTLNNNAVYNFNWSVLEQGRYEVSFTYLGKSNGFSNSNSPPFVFCNLGQMNSFTTSSTATNAIPTTLLGVLGVRSANVNNTFNYYASILDNPSIVINSLPKTNTINVAMNFENGTPFFDDSFATNHTVATTSGSNVITVAGIRTSGFPIRVGATISVAGVTGLGTIISFLGGSGGTGTYMCAGPANATVTAGVLTLTSSAPADYNMILRLEKVN